jgi:hypothetical protein
MDFLLSYLRAGFTRLMVPATWLPVASTARVGRVVVLSLCAALILPLVACDSAVTDDLVESNPDECLPGACEDDDDDPVGGDAGAVAFEGFTLSPEEGAFWEFAWEFSSWAGASGGSTSRGEFLITLGEPAVIAGRTAFPLEVCGDRAPDRWTHVAFEENQILGSENGSSFKVLFDGKRGAWAGSGFFRDMDPDVLVTAVESRIDNDFMQADAIRIGASTNSSQCEIIAGVRICGGESESSTHYEYWQPGVGPVGMRTRSAVGFFGSSMEIGLVDHSMTPVQRTDSVAAPGLDMYSRDVNLVDGPGLQFFAYATEDLYYVGITVQPPSPYTALAVEPDTSLAVAGMPIPLQDPDIGYTRIPGTWTFTFDVRVPDCPQPRQHTIAVSREVTGGGRSRSSKQGGRLVGPLEAL